MSAAPPPCVGGFEADDPECNGSIGDPKPCLWRDKCGAFRAHLRKSRSGIGRWVDETGQLVVDVFDFNQRCRQWVERYEIVDGVPKNERPPVGPKMTVDELFDLFMGRVVVETKRELIVGKLALPGQLFVIDKRKEFRGATLYCRATRGNDRCIVHVYPEQKSVELLVRLTVKAAVVNRFGLDLQVRDHRRGQFRSETRIDEHNAEALAAKIGGLIDSGKIRLPKRPA